MSFIEGHNGVHVMKLKTCATSKKKFFNEATALASRTVFSYVQ